MSIDPTYITDSNVIIHKCLHATRLYQTCLIIEIFRIDFHKGFLKVILQGDEFFFA